MVLKLQASRRVYSIASQSGSKCALFEVGVHSRPHEERDGRSRDLLPAPVTKMGVAPTLTEALQRERIIDGGPKMHRPHVRLTVI